MPNTVITGSGTSTPPLSSGFTWANPVTKLALEYAVALVRVSDTGASPIRLSSPMSRGALPVPASA